MKLLTGFGEHDTQKFVYFTQLVPANTGIVPDWRASLRHTEDAIVGSNNVEVQILGYGSARLETTLLFRSRDDYYRLQSMVGQKATLVLVSRLTRFRGRVFHRHGHDYEAYDDVLLIDLVPQMRVGATLATATFLRAPSGLGGIA